MSKRLKSHLKLVGLFFVVILCLLGNKCPDDKTDAPPGTPSGAGSGDYEISIESPFAYSFDCNTDYFNESTVNLNIAPSFYGFNRVYYTLTHNNGTVYRTNFFDFESRSCQFVMRFGGSLPYGYYSAVGHLQNYQWDGNSWNLIENEETEPLFINVTPCSQNLETITVEYNHQLSDTSAVLTYDLFNDDTLYHYINIAFNAGGINLNIFDDGYSNEAELVGYDRVSLNEYISANKVFVEAMYLCGIKGFKDTNGNWNSVYLGYTYVDSITYIPNQNTGSLIAYQACMRNHPTNLYPCVAYTNYIRNVTIHELGHQIAIASHTDHIGVNCVMFSGPMANLGGNYNALIGRIWNPHFCETCRQKLRN